MREQFEGRMDPFCMVWLFYCLVGGAGMVQPIGDYVTTKLSLSQIVIKCVILRILRLSLGM